MKHILVGVDFSRSADRALAYAEEIALKFSAKLSIVYVHPPNTGYAEEEEEQQYQKEGKALAELAASVADRGIVAQASTFRGEVVPTLRKIIATGDCELVVVGCQGEGFSPNDPWGSTTTSLLEDTRIPILAIPAYAPVKYPRRYVLATDKECPTRLRQLAPLLTLLTVERTQLLLFHYLQATEEDTTPHRAYARLLAGIKHRFYYQVDEHQPIGHAIADFAQLVAADLLVVTHRQDHWLGAEKVESVARRVTWMSEVPVLILQDSY